MVAVLLSWVCASQVTPGLTGDYWENNPPPATPVNPPAVPATPPTRTQVQTVIDFDDSNGNAPAAPVLPWICTPLDNFFARWTGYIRGPVTGTVTFETNSDDGVELRVNNAAIVTNWTFHAPTLNTGTFDMVQDGWYPIQILFFEGGGGARMRLQWSYTGQGLQVVPSTHLSATPPPPPATPALTVVQAAGFANAADASWTSSGAGATYELQRAVNGGAFTTVQTGQTGLTFQDPNLTYGSTSCYQVRATLGNLSSAFSSPPTCVTINLPPPRTNNHSEGFVDENCACGSTIGSAAPGALAALLALAFAGRRRRR